MYWLYKKMSIFRVFLNVMVEIKACELTGVFNLQLLSSEFYIFVFKEMQSLRAVLRNIPSVFLKILRKFSEQLFFTSKHN